MKRLYYLLCLVLIAFISCTQEMNEEQSKVDIKTLPSFADSDEFLGTFDSLSKLSKAEVMQWIKENNAYSALNTTTDIQDTLFKATPFTFQALFNRDLEVQIGDDIVKFCDGDLFIVTYADGKITTKTPYGIARFDDENSSSSTTIRTVDLGLEEKLPSIQHEFKINANNYTYKYVWQVRSFLIKAGYYYLSALTVDVKMEYKGSGSWKPAGRERIVSFSVEGTYYYNDYISGNINLKVSGDHWKDGYANYVLASENVASLSAGCWRFSIPWDSPISGNASQVIVGSPESAYRTWISY